jgi:TPR repeat protein
MLRLALFLLCALLPAVGSSQAFAAPTRIALIIANSNYREWDILSNPAIDANNLERTLRSLNYQVSVVRDGTATQIRESIDRLGAASQALAPGSVVLVYYAGHGVEVDGANYLIPIDAAPTWDGSGSGLINMREITESTGTATGITRVFLFDACRQVPAIWANHGFVRQDAPPDSLIGFSTALGAIASDGMAGVGSPFGVALTHSIQIPGIGPARLMQAIQRDVMFATGAQRPVYYSNADDTVALNGGESNAAAQRTTLAYMALERLLYANALSLALEAAEQGDVAGMSLAADLYSGFYRTPYEGVPINYPQSKRWHERAMRQGGLYEALRWARFMRMFYPNASRPDLARADRIIREAAERGNPWAMFFVGVRLETRSLAVDTAAGERQTMLMEALEWYRRSADAGYPEAAVNLGVRYETGRGVPLSRAMASQYYCRAAAANLPRGEVLFANIVSTLGEGRRDQARDAEALRLHRRAADAGEVEAMARLVIAYSIGLGVAPNRATALQWLDRYDRQQRNATWRNELIEQKYASVLRDVRATPLVVEPRVESRAEPPGSPPMLTRCR